MLVSLTFLHGLIISTSYMKSRRFGSLLESCYFHICEEAGTSKGGFESRIIPNRCRTCEQKGQLVWPEWSTGRPGQFPWKLTGQSNYFVCWSEAVYLVVKHFIAVLWCLIASFDVEQMICHVCIFIKLLLLSLQSTVFQFLRYVMML